MRAGPRGDGHVASGNTIRIRHSTKDGKAAVSLTTTLIALSYVAVLDSVQDQPIPRKSRFVLDGNRMYAELDFVRSDRSLHRALAYVDMGSPKMTIRESLFRDLNLDRQEILSFKVGDALVEVRTSDVITEPRPPSSVGSDLKVEAMLPASVLQRYQVVIDYRERSLVLARPGTIEPQGIPVPFSIHPVTGLAVVNASIFGGTYAMTVDNGSAYTWVRQRVAKQWTAAHPDWERGIGAVGPSNMMMSGDTTETMGILMRIPDIAVGSVHLRQAGVLESGRHHAALGQRRVLCRGPRDPTWQGYCRRGFAWRQARASR
jgi:hypothetical protein